MKTLAKCGRGFSCPIRDFSRLAVTLSVLEFDFGDLDWAVFEREFVADFAPDKVPIVGVFVTPNRKISGLVLHPVISASSEESGASRFEKHKSVCPILRPRKADGDHARRHHDEFLGFLARDFFFVLCHPAVNNLQ